MKDPGMTKQELIDRIISINRNVTPEFLAELSERNLMDYVRQLDNLGLGPTTNSAPYKETTVQR